MPRTTKKCARKIAVRFVEWKPAYFVLPVILFYVMLVNENHVNAVLVRIISPNVTLSLDSFHVDRDVF